ncbi:hypothetical protein [Kordia jejudonensis]|uniref:hypothetical protein n=1 Tax=Kordia jejudonensis TaxID=1348245 RepID=UPI000629C26E|nr:hypothetical protein [Kordia jejudonensis]
MMLIKIILIISLTAIFFQDVKERKVYWFLFPVVACCTAYLCLSTTQFEVYWRTSLINLSIIGSIFLVLQLYAKFKLKTELNEVFGLGDALLFIGFCVAFPVASFIVFFVFALLFSLLLHMVLKQKTKVQTVPLAGYMSIFLVATYGLHWIGYIPNLYTI